MSTQTQISLTLLEDYINAFEMHPVPMEIIYYKYSIYQSWVFHYNKEIEAMATNFINTYGVEEYLQILKEENGEI
jgi:hypothetical protein